MRGTLAAAAAAAPGETIVVAFGSHYVPTALALRGPVRVLSQGVRGCLYAGNDAPEEEWICGPRMEWSPGLTGWEVTCEIIDVQTGITIGRGTGIVTDDEKLWSTRPQFARRSMASTRAAGRALRLALGHLFVLLGDKVATVTREEMPDE